jgi:hypothetical protein
LEDWGKLITDVPSATAILDRFLHHAAIIAISGKSYRLRNQALRGSSPPENNGDEISKPAISPAGSPAGRKRKSRASEPTEACTS